METLLSFVRRAWSFLETGLEFLKGLWRRVQELVFGPDAAPAPSESQPTAQPAAQPAAPAAPLPAPQAALETTDEVALARMLASEDRNREIKIVIGWITVQKARAAKQSLYKRLTKGLGYGPQDRRSSKQGIMYASTAKVPSASDLQLARGILNGSIVPSAQIRQHAPGGWVERGQGTSDDRVIQLQAEWEEGIYAKLEGSRWVLYSRDTQKITIPPGGSAKDTLDQLPSVPALDEVRQPAMKEALA